MHRSSNYNSAGFQLLKCAILIHLDMLQVCDGLVVEFQEFVIFNSGHLIVFREFPECNLGPSTLIDSLCITP